ncbi:WD domain-containing protein, G-beta repeat-containing protein [Micromonospora citrea]|uniref:WD domain-containing protein, G-beta repeat-containing protein n=1 Tax=Micromonospora citrea TaxID=47855 RepID=A0A1C6VP92_9ACTN|nr:WD40 repeat domain-containing protein [Micromonospora citrea]SCL68141.1 WD domain-containing protein, G-beta repeat-containing protein [Micromonospora citrea]
MINSALFVSDEMPGGGIGDIAAVEVDGALTVVGVSRWGRDGVWVWEPARNVWRNLVLPFACAADPQAAQYPDAGNELDSLALAVSDGRVVLAAGGDEQGVAFWDVGAGELISGTSFDAPYVAAVAALGGGDGPARFVSCSGVHRDGITMWEPLGGPSPVELPESTVDALGTGSFEGRSLVVAGTREDVTLWDVDSRERWASLYTDGGDEHVDEDEDIDDYDEDADDERIRAVALARQGGGLAVVALTDSGSVLVWTLPSPRPAGTDGEPAREGLTRARAGLPDDLDEPDEEIEPVRDPFVGHEGSITALATAVVDDRPVVVTGGADGSVRVWDLSDGRALGAPLTGHRDSVRKVVTGTLRGRPVAVSAGDDRTVRVWDLAARAH